MEHTPPPFFKRGPSPLARLSFFSLLALVLMAGDARLQYLELLRQAVAVVIYPLQRLAVAPAEGFGRMGDFFVTQSSLIEENARLRKEHLADSAQLQRYQSLTAENEHLRKLLDARGRLQGGAVMAEILYAERNPFQRRVVIDKGAQGGVRDGQAVVDDTGVVGQVTRSYPWASEVTLITDKDHAVPVQSVRSGLRAIVFGSGEDGALEVRYMPESADIQNGDLLVTSGIDGTYPAGLPVATVRLIERNSGYPFVRVLCTPTAGVDRHGQVLVLAMPERHPERPAATEPGRPAGKKGKRGSN
ncbi:MAG TPA: rod shape-determining protein MreC [Burkholderiales bacterium]